MTSKYEASRQAAETRRRRRRQIAAGIIPAWKAALVIDAAMQEGATFQEAAQALFEVLEERGQKIRKTR